MNRRQIKVLLLFPGSEVRAHGTFGDAHLVGLGSAIQAWTGAQVSLIDLDYEAMHPLPREDLIYSIEHDLVGISCYSSYEYMKTCQLAAEIRRRNPKVCLVVGGYHASARPEDFIGEKSFFNHVVVGEGERPLTRIVEGLATGRPVDEQVLGPEIVEDLDELPPMDWSIIDRYREVSARCGLETSLYLSRGCPFACSFCMERAKGTRGWRAHSPKRAQEEILRLSSWLGLEHRRLRFCDPIFGWRKAWRLEMLERIAKLNVPIDRIWTLSRVDVIDLEDLEAFKRAGFSIGFGLESADPRMLEIIHKGGRGERYRERCAQFIERASAIGLAWGANLIAGHPGETPGSLERTARWIAETVRSIPRLSGFISVDPFRFYPGSRIDANLDEYARRYGTRVHCPHWWDKPDRAFTSSWIDPSSTLEYRQRERLTAELFMPILEEVQRRLVHVGPQTQAFSQGAEQELVELRPSARFAFLDLFHRWQATTGQGVDDPYGDEVMGALLESARKEMVAGLELRYGSFSEALRAALIEVPRERFLPRDQFRSALQERAVPLLQDGSATSLAPHTLALELRLLELGEDDALLELGGGTGYGAALVAQLVGPKGRVRTVVADPLLAERARSNLEGLDHVEVIEGSVALEEHLGQGFSKVIIHDLIDELPQQMATQLAVGGRCVATIRREGKTPELTLAKMTPSGLVMTSLGDIRTIDDMPFNSIENIRQRQEAAPAVALPVTTSAWADLVYHTLSMLPIDATDASNLYSLEYAAWIEKNISKLADPSLRTLPDDAELMAQLYDEASAGHMLQGFVAMWSNVKAFLAAMGTPFDQLRWSKSASHATGESAARALIQGTPLELLELFRIALWGEVMGGYLELRELFIGPNYARKLPRMVEDLSRAAQVMPLVSDADWVIVQPLRRAGRLLAGASHGNRPRLFVGLPDSELGVSRWNPIIQGCHELLLHRCLQRLPVGEAVSTRPGTECFRRHLGPEVVARSLGAAVFANSELEPPFLEWLQALEPQGWPGLSRRVPWDIDASSVTEDRATTELSLRLAAGDAVPPELKALHAELHCEVHQDRSRI